MKTIGKRYPGRRPNGDYRVTCDYCGADFYRYAGRVIRDPAGLLACPDDQRGRDRVTLDRLNAAGATASPRRRTEERR